MSSAENSQHLKWLALLALAVTVFYWRILFTDQFTVTEDWEAVNQGYVWHQFATRSIQEGVLPFWNAYAFSGYSFVGEMQPGLFYPLKLLLYLWPLDESGILSDRLFNFYYALAHLLAAVFMYFFAIEAGVRSRFGALVAGLCFALGGFVGKVWGHQQWDSAIWLPLILVCVFRAMRARGWSRTLLYSCCGGLALAMTILAGGMHAAIMDTLVVVTAALFLAARPQQPGSAPPAAARYTRALAVIAAVGVVTFAAAAVQLLPSIEYAPYAHRWGTDGTAVEKVPYQLLTGAHYLPPRALFGLLFGGAEIHPGEISPYLGVLPLMLAALGAWHYGRQPLVRYFSSLGVLALVYTLGPFSLLHGVLYLSPILDKSREPGRFIYLVHFAIALLAGFGIKALFDPKAGSETRLRRINRILGAAALITLLTLGISSVFGSPYASEWHYFSLLMLAGSWALLAYVSGGRRHRAVAVLVVGLILWDLYAFHWLIRNRLGEQQSGSDYYEQLLGARPVADFLHSQPGMFRVQVEGSRPAMLNLGPMFGVQTTTGYGATALLDYLEVWLGTLHGPCLTNTRYRVIPDQSIEGREVFHHGRWRVYENETACPRGWIVHEVAVEPSPKQTRERMKEPGFDPLRAALIAEPLGVELEPVGDGPPETVEYTYYQADRLEASIHAAARGLVVLSEVHFPGWVATLNGEPVPIHKVDSLLRGVVVEAGDSRLVMSYRPNSIFYGAILSGAAFTGTLLFGGALCWRRRKQALH